MIEILSWLSVGVSENQTVYCLFGLFILCFRWSHSFVYVVFPVLTKSQQGSYRCHLTFKLIDDRDADIHFVVVVVLIFVPEVVIYSFSCLGKCE